MDIEDIQQNDVLNNLILDKFVDNIKEKEFKDRKEAKEWLQNKTILAGFTLMVKNKKETLINLECSHDG